MGANYESNYQASSQANYQANYQGNVANPFFSPTTANGANAPANATQRPPSYRQEEWAGNSLFPSLSEDESQTVPTSKSYMDFERV